MDLDVAGMMPPSMTLHEQVLSLELQVLVCSAESAADCGCFNRSITFLVSQLTHIFPGNPESQESQYILEGAQTLEILQVLLTPVLGVEAGAEQKHINDKDGDAASRKVSC